MIHAVINATNDLSLINFNNTNLMKIAYEKLLHINYINKISVISKMDISEYLYNYHDDNTTTIIVDNEIEEFNQMFEIFKTLDSEYILYLSSIFPFISKETITRMCKKIETADSAIAMLETYTSNIHSEFKYPSCLWNSPLYIINKTFTTETGEMYGVNPYLNFLDKIESIKIENSKELYLFNMYYGIKNEIDKRFVR